MVNPIFLLLHGQLLYAQIRQWFRFLSARNVIPMIRRQKEFVINLTTKDLAFATDYCGVRSGRDYDKWSDCHLTKEKADQVLCPMIKESPVNIECKVSQIQELGSHHMFIADVVAVHVDDTLLDEHNTFHLNDSNLISYSHGTYLTLGEPVGKFGYSIQKKKEHKRKAKS